MTVYLCILSAPCFDTATCQQKQTVFSFDTESCDYAVFPKNYGFEFEVVRCSLYFMLSAFFLCRSLEPSNVFGPSWKTVHCCFCCSVLGVTSFSLFCSSQHCYGASSTECQQAGHPVPQDTVIECPCCLVWLSSGVNYTVHPACASMQIMSFRLATCNHELVILHALPCDLSYTVPSAPVLQCQGLYISEPGLAQEPVCFAPWFADLTKSRWHTR